MIYYVDDCFMIKKWLCTMIIGGLMMAIFCYIINIMNLTMKMIEHEWFEEKVKHEHDWG